MAIMIPSEISPEVKSMAEKRIFQWFKNAPGTDKWIVLHSLGIANHNRVIYGEMDFLVLAPQYGLFALEVKGGRVKRENGIWYFTNRYDKTTSKNRGPFEQAKEGIFSIIDALKNKVDIEHSYIGNMMYGYGVMFPDIVFTSNEIEEEQWQVFDSRDHDDVKKYIKRLSEGSVRKWESHYGSIKDSKIPDYADVKYIASILRGDFDFALSYNTQLRNAGEQLIALTNEQYKCLDQLDDNLRCLIHGPAGTGKTLLAIEEVKKSVARGEKVAFFCYNSNLAEWLSSQFENVDESLKPVYVGTIHKFMTNIAKQNELLPAYTGNNENQKYYETILPEAAGLSLLKSGVSIDKIIIDEAQDLIRNSYLEFLDVLLEKGLARGKWIMFGDFSMQAIYSNGISGDQMISKLEEITSFVRFRLTINCRNTKPICKEIENITGLEPPKGLWTKVDGPPVQIVTWSSEDIQCKRLSEILDRLVKSDIYPEQITILSPKKREESIVSKLEGYKIKDYKIPINQSISFCTIQSYKGLENTVIILTDIESFSSDKLMYVGLSRACSGLFLLISEAAKREYDDILIRRLLK